MGNEDVNCVRLRHVKVQMRCSEHSSGSKDSTKCCKLLASQEKLLHTVTCLFRRQRTCRRTRFSFRYPLLCRRVCVFLLRFSLFLNFPRYSLSPSALYIPHPLALFCEHACYFLFHFSVFLCYNNMKSADRRVFFVIPSNKSTTQFTNCACRILYFN